MAVEKYQQLSGFDFSVAAPIFVFCVESILSLNGFSMTVKSLINQLIGQHAGKGQLSVTVRSSHEAL